MKNAPACLFLALLVAQGAGVPGLENTYWRLMRLGEAPVKPDKLQREAYLVLKSETHRVSGSGGCNRLSGGYELDGSHLTFTRVAATRMACMNGMDTEKDFLASLSKVRTWTIAGHELKLFDSDGNSLVTFEQAAVPQ